MTSLALRVGWISLTTSAVLLPLLLLAGPICRSYRAKSCYLLWLMLAVRLLIPVELPLSQPPVTVELPAEQLVLLTMPGAEKQPGTDIWEMPQSQPGADGKILSPARIWTGVWSCGVVVTVVVQRLIYSTMKKKMWNNSVEKPEDRAVLTRLGGTVPVRRGDVETAMTVGFLHPVIFLPRELPREDVPMVLRHELCHLGRRDLWYKGVFLLCACVHWFNPLVWKLAGVAGAQLELCCDEDVVAGQDIRFRKEYGQLLLRSAAAGGTAMLSTRFGGSDLKGRIMNLFTKKKRGTTLVLSAACAAVMMSSLVGCRVQTAQPPAKEDTPEQSVSIQKEASTQPEQSGAQEVFLWPVKGEYTLSALHGGRTHPITGEVSGHNGVDILAAEGKAVLAALSGVVTESDFDKQYGNYVRIAHENGKSTLYGQMKECLVEVGDTITQGQVIGIVGKTGAATGAHLHFGVYQDEEAVDPIAQYPDASVELIMDGQSKPVKVEQPVVFN